jgi:PhnB protein
MKVEPYLFYNGRCEEAIEHYKTVFDAKVGNLMRFRDNPDHPPADKVPAALADKVMHAALHIGDTQIMMSDGMSEGAPNFSGASLAVTVATAREAERLFAAISAGGQVQMPIGPTFFSPRFGMAADKFGMSWMIIAEQAD